MKRRVVRLTMMLGCCAVFAACTAVIPLTQYTYPPRSVDAEVELIDGRDMPRPDLQRRLDGYDVIARFHTTVRSGDHYEEDVASKVEEAKATARERGGHALLYLHDSEIMATIYQDVHYAGPADRLVIYILRRKEE